MKKTVLLIVSLMFTALCVNAQASFGVKAGVNVASLTGKFPYGQKSKIGLNAGFVSEFPMSDSFSIQPELFYSDKGTQVVLTDGTAVKYKLDYVELPVLAKIYFAEGFSSFEIGPQIGLKLSEKVDGTAVEEDYARDFDTSLVAGLSYKFEGGIFVTTRYIYGIPDQFIKAKFMGSNYSRLSNIQFSLGYMF
ncbi:hypothetical protein NBRC110019_28900 [Neptunitalea chrysea]|uniref:Outer membrane protein beta-barrel domain-containing protein n=1 Tax=Neptunitalea chrysea TaxID=1647581 RepID=A0A9W6B931_9FLAO|nr:porin family protein [Neptunitalea chrysea]GLB53849.1 hypothetical protein NBRC110019_28900 [Neptunitalea chrysea]